MCTYRTSFPVPSVNPEVERVRIRRGKDVFAKSPLPGSVYLACTEEGVERFIWIEEINPSTDSIVFSQFVLGDREGAWAGKQVDMLFGSFQDQVWAEQVKYCGTMSPTTWPQFVALLLAMGQNPQWTSEFLLRAVPFLRRADTITERGSHPNQPSVEMGCQPVAESVGVGSRDLRTF